MIFLARPCHTKPDSKLEPSIAGGSLLLSACLTLGTVGCASPGIPRPPSLHLPATVTDLTASRIGDHVELHWTAPTRTTDGLDLTIPTQVEICRDPASVPAQCTVVLSNPGHTAPPPQPTGFPSLTASATLRPLLAYRIRILNPNHRSAPPPPAIIPGGPGPSSIQDFHAIQQEAGVLLEWQKSPNENGSASEVEAIRTLQTPPAAPTSNRRREQKAAEVHMRAGDDGSISSRQLQGMIDQGALQGETYTYRLQRVLVIPAAGKTIEIRSDPTAPITIAMHDVFPPRPPKGLASVPGTSAPPAGETTPRPTIDLSWQPNTEADAAGYLVYRTDLAASAGQPVRITATAIPQPAYRDTTVLPGHRYEYRVTAVDRSGNESAPSSPVQDTPEGH